MSEFDGARKVINWTEAAIVAICFLAVIGAVMSLIVIAIDMKSGENKEAGIDLIRVTLVTGGIFFSCGMGWALLAGVRATLSAADDAALATDLLRQLAKNTKRETNGDAIASRR